MNEAKHQRRHLVGTVVSDKMQKTVVVRVSRRVAHGKYGKFVTLQKKYKAHDERSEFHTGDRVEIVECRPLSREKRWRVARLLSKAVVQNLEVTS